MTKSSRGRDVEPLFSALLTAELRHVANAFTRHDPVALVAPQPEDVHEARTAIRRTRSYLKTFAPLFGSGDPADIRRLLGFYGSALSACRDLDVVAETVVRLLPDTHLETERSGVLSLIELRRRHELAQLHELAGDDRYVRVVSTMSQFATPEFADDVAIPRTDILISMLARPYRAVYRARYESLHDEKLLHSLRIRAKELRYACELVEPMFGDPVLRLARRAERIQNRIGDERNAQLAVDFLKAARRSPELATQYLHDAGHGARHSGVDLAGLIRSAKRLDRIDVDKLGRDIRALGANWRELRRVAKRRRS